jgi:hypothetical protein
MKKLFLRDLTLFILTSLSLYKTSSKSKLIIHFQPLFTKKSATQFIVSRDSKINISMSLSLFEIVFVTDAKITTVEILNNIINETKKNFLIVEKLLFLITFVEKTIKYRKESIHPIIN